MTKFAAVVVLYHPDQNVVDNILSYLPHVDSVLLVDNTEPPKTDLIEKIPKSLQGKIKYLPNLSNEGIAVALNQGAQFSISSGADWLLTMDQDSAFTTEALEKMVTFVKTTQTKNIAIVTPFHFTPNGKLSKEKGFTSIVPLTMTSGNLLNINAFQKCGPFDERLFIDSVDHEYCLRVRKMGYSIIRINHAILKHNLGAIQFKKILFAKVKTTNHSAIRRYYMTRNRLAIIKKYFWFDLKYVRRETKHLITDFFKVLFFESGKFSKILKMILGVYHFAIGKMGKLN